MNREQKRKLALIAVLGAALLVGGTFAFTAFNQQAINDRLRENDVEVGGRVHDYYNRDTENKDVFVENYGHNDIMARIRLSEFMEIQERGQSSFTPVVEDTERTDVTTWSTYLPAANNLNVRTGEGANRFNDYSSLSFGRQGTAPWYLPTFNHDIADLRTAAAGHARDYLQDGATHPGEGTDNFWSENENHDNSAGTWPGSMTTRETAQNLNQERPPMTMEQWLELDDTDKIGNFWVVDYQTGWAYWASKLEGGQATSYLLDAAEMQPDADAINGSYYYGIHVASDLVSPENRGQFLEADEEGEHHRYLEAFLNGINDGEMADGWRPSLPTENPPADQPSDVGDFNFGLMSDTAGSNSTFILNTPAGPQEFRYLENKGNGYHLIIRNDTIVNISFNDQELELTRWFNNDLPADFKAMVAPVASSFTTGIGNFGAIAGGWSVDPTELANNAVVAADLTEVVPLANGGVSRAFSLSLADVQRLSAETPGIGFMNMEDRGNGSWWILRTPSGPSHSWVVGNVGNYGFGIVEYSDAWWGIRPALILHQPGT